MTILSATLVIPNKPQYFPRVGVLIDAYPMIGGDKDGRTGILAVIFGNWGPRGLYDVHPGAKIGGRLCI